MSQLTEGRKYDNGKPEYGLIPPFCLEEMAKVLTAGAKKYSRDNWVKVPDGERRYFDAMQRHIWAWKRGEVNDPEDGLHHLAHAACCLFFLHDLSVIYNGGIKNEVSKEQNEGMAQEQSGKSYGTAAKVRNDADEFVKAISRLSVEADAQSRNPTKYCFGLDAITGTPSFPKLIFESSKEMTYNNGSSWGADQGSIWNLVLQKEINNATK